MLCIHNKVTLRTIHCYQFFHQLLHEFKYYMTYFCNICLLYIYWFFLRYTLFQYLLMNCYGLYEIIGESGEIFTNVLFPDRNITLFSIIVLAPVVDKILIHNEFILLWFYLYSNLNLLSCILIYYNSRCWFR